MTRRDVEIIELAESISLEYFPDKPVQPEFIASQKSITYDYDHYGFECFDGLIEQDSGNFHIYMNLDQVKSKDSGRARFTFSHELGHYFNDDHRRLLMQGVSLSYKSLGSQNHRKVEREANLFATNLLMPKDRFISISGDFNFGLDSILNLGSVFDTSIMNTAFHYVNCDISPIALIKWNSDFTIDKSCLSKSFKSLIQVDKPIFKFDKNKIGTGDSKGFQNHKSAYEQSEGNLSSWIVNVPFGSKNDLRVLEQTIKLSPYGGATFLVPLL